MKAIIKNLRNGERERILLCPVCGNEGSADKADYFWASNDMRLTCCGRTMDIVVKRTHYVEVR